jgi:hypothetical protein
VVKAFLRACGGTHLCGVRLVAHRDRQPRYLCNLYSVSRFLRRIMRCNCETAQLCGSARDRRHNRLDGSGSMPMPCSVRPSATAASETTLSTRSNST